MLKKGKDLETRALRTAVHTLRVGARFSFGFRAYNLSYYIFYTVLSKCAFFANFRRRLRDTFFQIIFIQQRFRNVRDIMYQRTLALRTNVLFYQTFLITAELQKEDKKNTELCNRILKLSDAKKDFITDTFIFLAKLDFRIQFLEWFLRSKRDSLETERVKETNESIENARAMMRNLMKFIANGDENVIMIMNLKTEEKRKEILYVDQETNDFVNRNSYVSKT